MYTNAAIPYYDNAFLLDKYAIGNADYLKKFEKASKM